MVLKAMLLTLGTVVAGVALASPADAPAGDVASAEAAKGTAPVPRSITKIDGVPVTPKDVPFLHGESLTYSATWMNMSVGEATMTVDTNATFEGKPAIHLKGSAKSNSGFSLFYSIKDAGESWIDPVGLYSLGFVSDQNSGNIQDYQKWVIDNERGVANRTRVRRKNGGKVQRGNKDHPMTATHVQDAASMLYFFRAFDLKVGQKLESDVFVSRKVWKLEIEVIGKEKVKVPAGTFDTLKVRPKVSLNGQVQKKGEMTIWVTDDERKIPVKMQSEIPLGKVNAVLTKIKEGKQ